MHSKSSPLETSSVQKDDKDASKPEANPTRCPPISEHATSPGIENEFDQRIESRRSIGDDFSVSFSDSSSLSELTVFSGRVDDVTGEIVYGKKKDRCTGEVYEGPFLQGQKHGDEAVCTWPDGRKFVGSYRNDHPSEGTLTSPSYTYKGKLSHSVGKFADGYPLFHDDNANLVRKNGDVYNGGFYMGSYHGYGLEKTSRYEYAGYFKFGNRHGRGKLHVAITSIDTHLLLNPDPGKGGNIAKGSNWTYVFTGLWSHGLREGEGKEILFFSFPDNHGCFSSCYKGMFQQDQRHGLGTLTLFDGTVLQATWRDGRPLFTFVDTTNLDLMSGITFPSGSFYRGEFCIVPIAFDVLEDITQRSETVASPSSLTQSSQSSFMRDYHDILCTKWYQFVLPHGHGTLYWANKQRVYTGTFKMGAICRRSLTKMYLSDCIGGIKGLLWIHETLEKQKLCCQHMMSCCLSMTVFKCEKQWRDGIKEFTDEEKEINGNILKL